MQVIQVCKLPHDAFTWVPEGLQTTREVPHEDCRCNGSGYLGELDVAISDVVMMMRGLACPCLHVHVPVKRAADIEDQVNQHFVQMEHDGILCPCMFCKAKRKIRAVEI